ncbi:MAG TPA: alpha/beta hydrolase [Anaerolineales bacterium]|nr:alpha/beta hydrolase [Anaerolineales bacterium]
MSNWISGEVELEGVSLHYTRTGGAKPPLVLAHGVTDDGLCWSPLARVLEAEWDCIMVDARGHGRSSAPETGYDPLTQGRDLAGLIAALGLRQPAVLGHSMGAGSTLGLASQFPEAVGAILLEDPPMWWRAPDPNDTTLAERAAGMGAWIAGLKLKTREELIAAERVNQPAWSDEELGPWADAKLRVSPHVARIFKDRFVERLGWPEALRTITCPALLISADPERGAIVTAEGAASLQAYMPQLQLVHIPGAGHNVRREQFAAYVQAVRGFLTSTGV